MLCFSYSRQSNSIAAHMESNVKVIVPLSVSYENFVLIGYLNATESDTSVKDFCIYSFKNLLKRPTYLKTWITQNTLTKIMANRSKSFQNLCVIETRLPGFHKMTVTVLRFVSLNYDLTL